MDILLPSSGHPRRIPGLDFDTNGPKVGASPLLTKTDLGFVSRPKKDLEALLQTIVEGPFDAGHVHERLAAIGRALTGGDVALAAIMTSRLRLPLVETPILDVAALKKASPDDPVRPGWPAKTPGGLGGKFRPKTGVAFDPTSKEDRAERLLRLERRRGIRAVLRRVLTAKRAARLLMEGLGEAVPGLDALDTAAMVEDVAEIAAEIAEENVEVEAAETFVEGGPRTLEELMMSKEDESFASFDAFKKIDLEKRFGRARDGYEYHHIVEQSADFPQAELQSTSNIVQIPKLLHEEINAEFARVDDNAAVSLRESLRGSSFTQQREAGLAIMRKIGILYP